MAEYIEYHPLKFWLDPASIAEIVAHIQTYLVNNPINSTTEIESIIHNYLITHPDVIGGVRSINGETGEVVLTADNISAGETVTIKDVLDSLQDQIDDIVASIPSDYQQLIDDVSDLKSDVTNLDSLENNAALAVVKKQSTLYPCNIFNKNEAIRGRFNSSGQWIPNNSASYACSPYVSVFAGDSVRRKSSNNYTAFFNRQYALIGSVISGQTVSIAPSDAAFVRVACAVSDVDSYMVFINSDMPSSYYAFGDGPHTKINLVNESRLQEESKYLKNNTLEEIAYTTGGTIKKDYLFRNPVEIIENAYINASNKIEVDPSLSTYYKVYVYKIYNGEVCKLKGDNCRLAADLPIAVFTTSLDSEGTLIQNGSTTETNYNISYTAAADGYIVVAKVIQYNTLNVSIYSDVVDFEDFHSMQEEVAEIIGDPVYYKTGDAISETNHYLTYYINNGGEIKSLGESYSAFDVHEIPVSANIDYLIVGNASLSGSFPIAGFKTTSGTSGIVSILAMATNKIATYNVHYKPSENGYIFIASSNGGATGILEVYEAIKSTEGQEAIERARECVENPWYGKKVVWLGTSVSFGQLATKSYAQEIANYLGFTLVNCSVPGLAIEMSNGEIKQYGSLTASKAEYTAAGWTIPDAPVTPYVPGGSYNNYYRTWENVFTQENADADLWVFDVVPNNGEFSTTDWDAFNKNTWAYNDSSAFSAHRNTFLGALLFLMDKMYTLNPNARMVLLLGSSFSYANGKTAYEQLVSQWKIGMIDLWGKINTAPPSLSKIKSENGTNNHPSTFAHELMGKMLVGEFNRFA